MTRLVAVLMILVGGVVLAAGQAPVASTPEFDVASVKPTSFRFHRPMDSYEGMLWKARMRWSERIFARDAPLAGLIQMGYDVWRHQIEGLPGWVDSARYEIDARASGAQFEEMRLMMRTLLADRFKLAFHREARSLSVLELVPAEGGIKIAPVREGDCFTRGPNSPPVPFSPPPAPMPRMCGASRRIVVSPPPILVEQVEGVAVAMSRLIDVLSAEVGRIVIDRTNFNDRFSYQLTFTPGQLDAIPGAGLGRDLGGPIEPLPSAPTISYAIKEQLGLELKPSTGRVEVLVIDHIERPSPN